MSRSWVEQLPKLWSFRLPTKTGVLPRGVYHYRREVDGSIVRFHLRIEEDGSGMMLANSSVAALLSGSGAWIAKALLDGKTTEQVRSEISRNFRGINPSQLEEDLETIHSFIQNPTGSSGEFPVFNLADPEFATPRTIFAPVHAQIPMAPISKIRPLLEKLWEVGIPHVTFHAMPSSLMDDAVLNVEKAEDLGMICGVKAQATWLRFDDVMKRIAMAGVDYVIVPFISTDRDLHNSIFGDEDFAKALMCFRDCKELEVCPVAEVPLLKTNVMNLRNVIELLEAQEVRNINFYPVYSEHHHHLGLDRLQIIQAAVDVQELADNSSVRYVWLPGITGTEDMKLLLQRGPRTGGDTSLRVHPDGQVFAPRGPLVPAGNLLNDPWNTIWNHPVFRDHRQRLLAPTHCDICPGLKICASDCPARTVEIQL